LINLLQSQAAFFDVGRSHYEEVYQLAFDDYVYDGQFVSTFRTSKRVFTSKDNLLTSLWFELLEVVEEARDSGDDLDLENIYELAVESDIAEDDRNDLSISVMSPGWFRLRSITATPLVTMALFAMAAGNVTYNEAKSATVSARVVRAADTQCLGEVDESVRDYLELLGQKRWEQACSLATKATEKATLKTDAKLTKTQKRAKHRK
jgi:hypothetical protein